MPGAVTWIGRVASSESEIAQRPAGRVSAWAAGEPSSTVGPGDHRPPITGGAENTVAVPPARTGPRPPWLEQLRIAPGSAPSASVRRGPTGPVRLQSTKSAVRRTERNAGGGPLAYAARVVMTNGNRARVRGVTESKSNLRNTSFSRRSGLT